MASEIIELKVPEALSGKYRLDKWLAGMLTSRSRSQIQRWITGGCVSVNHRVVTDSSFRVQPGSRIEVRVPPPEPSGLEPAPVSFTLIYEDADILVVNKPAGVPMHPGSGHLRDTLLNGLLYAGKTLSPIGLPWRPGVVHRLDKDTSGLLVLAKTETAHLALAKALQLRTVHRKYLAFVVGIPVPSEGTLTSAIGRDPFHRTRFSVRARYARSAVTHYRVLHSYPSVNLSLLELQLETGRTHQIRVHLSAEGYPVLGDPVYGGRKNLRNLPPSVLPLVQLLPGQFLHAASLSFAHPVSGDRMQFSAPPPKPFDLLHARLAGK